MKVWICHPIMLFFVNDNREVLEMAVLCDNSEVILGIAWETLVVFSGSDERLLHQMCEYYSIITKPYYWYKIEKTKVRYCMNHDWSPKDMASHIWVNIEARNGL